VNAIAIQSGYTNSAPATATYLIANASALVSDLVGGLKASAFNLNGGATVTSNGYLQLTDGGTTEARSAWLTTKLPIQNFTTDFTFQQLNPNGDGMTFAIQALSPTALGMSGGGLGYQNISSSVAVKFDLFNNNSEGPNSTGLYTNGAPPTIPAIDLTSTGINLHNADLMDAHIVYNGTNLTLTLTDTVTGAVATEVWPVNIPSIVGGNTAYVGFTGGAGGVSSTQQILSWSYVNGSSSVQSLPPAVAATPTFTPAAGAYTTAQSVTLADATAGATIYYTTNGTTPTTASTQYTGAISVAASETLQAIAVATGYTNSSVATAAYTMSTAGQSTYINYPSNGFTSTAIALNSGATVSSGILNITDGGTEEARTAWFKTQVPVQSFVTDFTFQQLNATGDGMTFTIQGKSKTATGYAGGGLGYQNIPTSVGIKFDLYSNAGEGPNSTGLYLDGVIPTVPAIDLTSTGINLHSADVMHAHMVYDGTNLTMTLTDTVTNATAIEVFPVNIPATVGANTAWVGFTGGTGSRSSVQQVLSWSFSSAPVSTAVAATPVLSPAGGTYTSAQSVTITDATAGTTIYYTTNGTTPTTASAVYSGAIAVGANETVQAIAVETGYTNSSVASASYIIAPVLPAPAFSVAAGTYSSAQSVTITDATAGTTIYYTTNGTTPTTASTVYSGAVPVSANETLEAIAVETGYTNSPVSTAAYVINLVTLPAPTFSVAAGTYGSTQSVTISDATAGTTIYYTTNGTTPTTASTVYSGAVSVSATETLEAIAVESGYTTSPVATASYTIATGLTTYVNYAAGKVSASTLALNNGATVTGGLLKLTDGGTWENRSAWYTSAVPVQTFITDFTFQQINPVADGMTFTIQGQGTGALGSDGGGLGYQGIPTSVAIKFDLFSNAGEGANSTGIYTDGASPTVPAVTLAGSAINLHSGDTMRAHFVYDGTTLTLTLTDTVTNGTYTTAFVVNIPSILGENTGFIGFTAGTGGSSSTQEILTWTYQSASVGSGVQVAAAPAFSPAGGTYATTQTVTLTAGTSVSAAPATIYFTTNGTTPTTASKKYTGPITVSASETLQAITVEAGYTNSAVSSATYTIVPILPAPAFSLPSGSYNGTQSVTLSDSKASTIIYYTTDGSTPTTASTKYTTAIKVTAPEVLQAIATRSGYADSPVASVSYTIVPATPAPHFSPAAGSYTKAQNVVLSDTVTGATIYYTTDGTTPTTSSAIYTGAIPVSVSETVQAIAIAPGYTTSATAKAAYTMTATTTTTTTAKK
jgi:hypothetical protein